MLFILLSSALAASDPALKIQEHLAAGRPDKAWEACQKQAEKGPLQGDALRSACATADLENALTLAAPASLDLARLDAHWLAWAGTEAAKRSKEMAAKKAFPAAGDDTTALEGILSRYGDTSVVTDVYGKLWKKALDLNTPEAMITFSETYPNAPQVATAKSMSLDLAWQLAEKTNTVVAWRSFQAAWPEHPRREQARAREESLAFKEAEEKGTTGAWEALIANYPQLPRLPEARSRLLDAGYNTAKAQGSAAILAFALAHPEYPRASGVLAEALKAQSTVTVGTSTNMSAPLPQMGPLVSPPTAAAGASRLSIKLPAATLTPVVTVEMVVNGQRQPLAAAMPLRLKAAGMPDSLIPPSWPVKLESPVGAVWSARLPPGLCQPDGNDTFFAAIVKQGDVELGFPFRLQGTCSAQVAALKTTDTVKVQGKTLRFGMSQADFLKLFPDWKPATAPVTGLSRLCATELCADFYADMLLTVVASCGGATCTDTKSLYQLLRSEMIKQLQKAAEETINGGTIGLFSKGDVIAREVKLSAQSILYLTHRNLLAFVRSRIEGYLPEVR